MRSHRGSWLGPCLMAAALVASPSACTIVRAQSGYSPDPYNPYNNQYDPYVFPIGPAEPMAGGRAEPFRRDGVRGPTSSSNTSTASREEDPGGTRPTARASACPIIAPPWTHSTDRLGRGSTSPTTDRTSRSSRPRSGSPTAISRTSPHNATRPSERGLLQEYRGRRNARSATTGRDGSSSRTCQPVVPRAQYRSGRRIRLSVGTHRRAGAAGGRRRPLRARPRGPGHQTRPAVWRTDDEGEYGHRRPQSVAAMDLASGFRSGREPSVAGSRTRRPGSGVSTAPRPGSGSRRTRPPASDASTKDVEQPVIGPIAIPSHRRLLERRAPGNR